MKRVKTFLPVILSALLVSLSRIPLHIGFLVFFAFVPLLWFFEREYHRPWQLLIAGMLFSGVFVAVVLNWISEVTPGGVIGIFVIFGFYYWLVFYAIQRIWYSFSRLKYAGFVLLFVAFEYSLNFTEMRFPWFNISYGLADYNILLQALDIIGTVGLSLLVLVVNVLVWRSRKQLRTSIVSLVVILGLWLGYGFWCYSAIHLEKHDAGIYVMQPSIPQDVKWDETFFPKMLKTYDKLTSQAAAENARLIIYPEAAMPIYLLREPGQIVYLERLMRDYKLDVFTGFPDCIPAPPGYHYPYYYYNAAALFSPGQKSADPYYKCILVPVGERMLWLDKFPFLWKLEFGQANWEFGKELKWYKSGDYKFSPSICYEIAFADIHHRMAIPRDPKTGQLKKTDYLVNITNDAWFGTSYGPWLHGVMARYRAIENRIQIYRSAQTGISMILDPLGRTLAKTELFEVTNITAPLYTTTRIPLLRYIYRYPRGLSLLAVILFVVACFKRRGKQERRS
ncbi:MAG TPA: apolipoprotein N-acyltransferase [Candidatus Cloacimonadota bacterium]|nr:apolipoprotein N-acyltransferase [Candidatus Cloacimonadota bacterium]